MSPDTLFMLPMWYVAFLLSLTCHEAAHALAAKWGGDLTAYNEGQVSLSPLPHMKREPLGTIAFPIITFFLSGWMMGWASAPYDPYWQIRHPRRAALMALAGPIANFILVAIAAVLIRVGITTGVFEAPGSIRFAQLVIASQPGIAEAAATFLSILFSLNLLLGTFNLLPVPPLDGITAIGLFLPEETALKLADIARNSQYVFLGLFVAWKVFDEIFAPIFSFALKLLHPGLTYG